MVWKLGPQHKVFHPAGLPLWYTWFAVVDMKLSFALTVPLHPLVTFALLQSVYPTSRKTEKASQGRPDYSSCL